MRETFSRMADRMENLSRRVGRRGNGVLADQYMDYAMSYLDVFVAEEMES